MSLAPELQSWIVALASSETADMIVGLQELVVEDHGAEVMLVELLSVLDDEQRARVRAVAETCAAAYAMLVRALDRREQGDA